MQYKRFCSAISLLSMSGGALFFTLPSAGDTTEPSGRTAAVAAIQAVLSEESAMFEPAAQDERRVRASVTAGVWIPRLRGTVGFGPTGGDLRHFGIDTELDLGDLEPSISADATLAIDRWHVRLSAFDFNTDGSDELPAALSFGSFSVPSGSTLHSSLDVTSLSVDVGYELWRPFDRDNISISISPTLFARYMELDHTVSTDLPVSPSRASVSPTDLGILGGGRVEIDILDALLLRTGVGFGANLGGGGVWQIDVDATWMVHPNIGLTFGYRLVDSVIEDDDYEFDGQLAGLFFGGAIRF